MYHFLQNNRNVIMAAVTLFIVSLTTLLFFLTGQSGGNHDLQANIVDSLDHKSQQEEEKTYRQMVDEQEGPITVLGTDGSVQFTSWEFESLIGYSKESMKEELFYSSIHPEDLSLFVAAFNKVLTSDSPVMMIGPYRMRSKDDAYQVHMASLYPIQKDAEVTSIIVSVRDITKEIQQADES